MKIKELLETIDLNEAVSIYGTYDVSCDGFVYKLLNHWVDDAMRLLPTNLMECDVTFIKSHVSKEHGRIIDIAILVPYDTEF